MKYLKFADAFELSIADIFVSRKRSQFSSLIFSVSEGNSPK